MIFNRKPKKYYREYMSQCGWGVMLGYDTIMATSKRKAAKHHPTSMYASDKSFELITKVKKEHLHLSDEEVSKLYGKKMRKLLISLFRNVIRACLKRNEDPVKLFNEALKDKQ